MSNLIRGTLTIDGLSIPFFSLGRRVHSITYTWSRNPSMDRRDEPAWTTHARRVIPGQDIVINRDEDPEEGDIGIVPREKVHNEKVVASDDSQNSSSSRTAGRDETYEMEDREGRDDTSGSRSSYVDDEDGSGNGNRTPPLTEYREGHHLIIERKVKGSDEVGSNVGTRRNTADFRSRWKSSGIISTTTRRRSGILSGIRIVCKATKWNGYGRVCRNLSSTPSHQ